MRTHSSPQQMHRVPGLHITFIARTSIKTNQYPKEIIQAISIIKKKEGKEGKETNIYCIPAICYSLYWIYCVPSFTELSKCPIRQASVLLQMRKLRLRLNNLPQIKSLEMGGRSSTISHRTMVWSHGPHGIVVKHLGLEC